MSHALNPQSRVLLNDALRPPSGCRVEVAVGTTYTLNLTSLLLAPLSFALADTSETGDMSAVDPIRLLEAVRRYSDVTTVFTQAGGIAVPADYRSILTFVEDSVHEVMPPGGNGIFHPKIWALRFVDDATGEARHRLVVASRNLTFDRSWDTALVLDELPTASRGDAREGPSDAPGIDAGPAADFLLALPDLAVRDLPAPRLKQITDLAASLRGVRFEPPAPYDSGTLLPIGVTDEPVWPFPERARQLLAISPFLTASAVTTLGRVSRKKLLLSRPESLDLLGSAATDGWSTRVLQRLAEASPEQDITAPATTATELDPPGDGLHAKTFVLDLPERRSMLVTGSANLTSAPWGRGVEFDVTLEGPTHECGVNRLLQGTPTSPGLGPLIEEYTPERSDARPDPTIETSRQIERLHTALATADPRLHIEPLDEERVRATLTWDLPPDAHDIGDTRVWLSSLGREAAAQRLAASHTWTLAAVNVTPFIAVDTTAGEGPARTTRQCALMARLTGAVDNRRHDAVFSVLTSKAAVLRYLVLLLGDPAYDTLAAQWGAGGERWSMGPGPGFDTDEVALLEPLVRAIGQDESALARIAALVEELRAHPDGADLVPDGFDDLWDAVWEVHQGSEA